MIKTNMYLSLILLLLVSITSVVSAQTELRDCGEQPLDTPAIPDGATATADQIREARDAVLNYSEKVDDYLACMDVRANALFTYMTEQQRTQFNNDLADIHNRRRELQIKMNEAIRGYRDAQR